MDTKLIKLGFDEKQFNTNGIKINYIVGPNHVQPLVLIPAQIGTWESYQKNITYMQLILEDMGNQVGHLVSILGKVWEMIWQHF